jgi:hypothetical protein
MLGIFWCIIEDAVAKKTFYSRRSQKSGDSIHQKNKELSDPCLVQPVPF